MLGRVHTGRCFGNDIFENVKQNKYNKNVQQNTATKL